MLSSFTVRMWVDIVAVKCTLWVTSITLLFLLTDTCKVEKLGNYDINLFLSVFIGIIRFQRDAQYSKCNNVVRKVFHAARIRNKNGQKQQIKDQDYYFFIA